MAQNPGQRRATDAVHAEMARRGWNKADLEEASGLDYGTVSDFLEYKRSAQWRTLSKIEDAIGWERGTYREIALGRTEVPEPAEEEPQADSGTQKEARLIIEHGAAAVENLTAAVITTEDSRTSAEITQALPDVMAMWYAGMRIAGIDDPRTEANRIARDRRAASSRREDQPRDSSTTSKPEPDHADDDQEAVPDEQPRPTSDKPPVKRLKQPKRFPMPQAAASQQRSREDREPGPP